MRPRWFFFPLNGRFIFLATPGQTTTESPRRAAVCGNPALHLVLSRGSWQCARGRRGRPGSSE
eukprot:12490011-Prorocentrum_lima.AAC.1